MSHVDVGEQGTLTASIIVPAHNEGRGIARLLDGLLDPSRPGEFEIVVVCNGCTDDTVAVARGFEPRVRVLDIPEPSKRHALRRGDREATGFPRLYVDADVQVNAVDVRTLVDALKRPDTLAVAPGRTLPRDGVSTLVRAYYTVWEELPSVRQGLFGRGVIAMSEQGHARVSALPPVMSDDLAISEAFSDSERRVVPAARVIVRPPRTMRDLLRRRVRVNTGNAELDSAEGRSEAAKTSLGDLGRIALRRPQLAPGVVVFLLVALTSRWRARQAVRAGDFTTWLRDESSRAETE